MREPDKFDKLALELWKTGGVMQPIPRQDELKPGEKAIYQHRKVKFMARRMREEFGTGKGGK